MSSSNSVSTLRGLTGLSPVLVFLLLYLVVSLVTGDFYAMPFPVALLAASVWGVLICRGPLTERIEIFSRAAGHSNIIYMIWVFILAGAFAALAEAIGAVDATVALTLRLMPASLVVPGMFVAACLVSLAVGTSVGTVVALTPLAVSLAGAAGDNVPFMVAVVLGGAFFGDNLSFISDTTLAATRTQGCDMADKFRANAAIVLPAAVVTLALYVIHYTDTALGAPVPDASPWLALPYAIVIAAALARLNVNLVLTLGIASALIAGLAGGHSLMEMCGYMGEGIGSMGALIVVTLMSAGMLGLVEACGGIRWLLGVLTARVSSRRGGAMCIGILVSLVNMCTANNTVAIITVGPLARDIAARFGIEPRRSASLLDTCSCIVQCLIPYGAQTLLATSLAGISPAAPFGSLYYPWALAGAVVVSIVFMRGRR